MLIKNILLISLLFVSGNSYGSPLNLNWKKKHIQTPLLNEYSHSEGSPDKGLVVYFGGKSILNMEAELQAFFFNKRLSRALLILGPTGIDSFNCRQQYAKIISLLNEKYGHYKFKKVTKDSIANDLLFASYCSLIKQDLLRSKVYWRFNNFKIISELVGDEEGFYIEVEYVDLSNVYKHNLKTKRQIIKSL